MPEDPREDDITPDEMTPAASDAEMDPGDLDSTGDAALDRQLSKPVIEGMHGIDTAQVWIAGFLIVVAGLIAYSNAFGIPFHYLDQQVIVENADAHRIASVADALKVDPSAPIPMFTYAMNWLISGNSPFLFHIVNILLHTINALMVYLICRRLMDRGLPEPISMAAGLFVALNPLATESVNYVVGRAELLVAFFTLAAILFFLRGTQEPVAPKVTLLACSLLAFVAAWYCSAVALLIPLFVFAIDWVMSGKRMVTRLPIHGVYWALACLLLASWFASYDRPVAFSQIAPDSPQATNVDRASAFMHGLSRTISPVGLTPDYNIPPRGSRSFLEDESVNVGLSVMNGSVLALAAIVLMVFRSQVGFALLWFATSLAWTVFSFSSANPFSERGLYLPLCGIVLIVPWLIAKASARKVTLLAAAAAVAILLIVAGSGTYLRNRVWQTPQTLWEDAVAKNENAPFPLARLGELYFNQATTAYQESVMLAQDGQGPAAAARREESQQLFAAAEETLTAALDANPADAVTAYRLGRCALFRNDVDTAVDRLRDALWLDPSSLACTTELAVALSAKSSVSGSMNDRLHAIDYFKRASELGRLPAELRTQFATLLTSIGDLDAAEFELKDVVASSDYAPARQQLEVVQRTRNVLAEGEQRAQQILSANPTSVEGRRLQAEVLMGRGMLLQASYVLARLLRQYPNDLGVWVMQGTARAMVNDEDGFLSQWPRAPAAETGAPSGWLQLARSCAAAGRWGSARIYLEAAAGRAPDVALPLVSLGELALSMNQPGVATPFLEEATEKYPDSPRAWLLLCDVAIASENPASAQRYLNEAERRGAAPADVEARRSKIGTAPAPEEDGGFQTILR